jgi:GTPase SAR1 family protein
MPSLHDIKRVTATEPPRLVIYGPPGAGKSTLASEFPTPVFIQTERGNVAGLEFDSFGHIESWTAVLESLRSLADAGHDYQTVVLDSLDKLEPLIWDHVCAFHDAEGHHERREHWESIEAPGYGKGYVEVDKVWQKFFAALDYLNTEIKMSVVLIGHSAIVNWPNPAGAEFPRWDIRLHKRAHAIVEDSVDAILMLNFDDSVTKDKTTQKVKSSGSKLRWINCEGSPALNAKNRYKMPAKIMYQENEGYSALRQYFPNGNSKHIEE